MSADRPGERPQKRRLTLLLADDDESFQLLVRDCLEGSDDLREVCSLICVNDGAAAADYALGLGAYADRDRHPLPDLVLLDERMIRTDGSEALRAIKAEERGRQLPVCLMSTSAPEKWRRLCYGLGATFCIRKPMQFEALRRTLRLLVEFFTQVMELPREEDVGR
jgi:CheY-like chemotaxis protein